MSFRRCASPNRRASRVVRCFLALTGIALWASACSPSEETDENDDGLGAGPNGARPNDEGANADDDTARPGGEAEGMPEPAGGVSDDGATDDEAPVSGDGENDPDEPAPLTWYGRVQPILEARCTGCHVEGGIAPFPLATYEHASSLGGLIRSAVEDRRMPPMPADDRNCRELSDSRLMGDDERSDLVAWVESDMPEGDPSDAPSKPPRAYDYEPDLGPATSVATTDVVYERSGTKTDDYRCIIVDPGWTEPTHLEAISVEPGNTSIVHHVIVYAQLPEDAEEVDALDAADPEPGYECVGNALFEGARAVESYVPGSAPRAFPGGATLTAPAGTRFVMQIHYNFFSGEGKDSSSLAFWEVARPSGVKSRGLVLIDADFVVPAEDAEYSITASSTIVAPGEADTEAEGLARYRTAEPGFAWGASAHMHLQGRSAFIELVRKDGSKECLLDIPQWNFNWQGDYRFREPIELFEGDTVQLTCSWDNSAENQPVVDGERLPSRDLTWGEGSLDEMCLGTVKITPR